MPQRGAAQGSLRRRRMRSGAACCLPVRTAAPGTPRLHAHPAAGAAARAAAARPGQLLTAHSPAQLPPTFAAPPAPPRSGVPQAARPQLAPGRALSSPGATALWVAAAGAAPAPPTRKSGGPLVRGGTCRGGAVCVRGSPTAAPARLAAGSSRSSPPGLPAGQRLVASSYY